MVNVAVSGGTGGVGRPIVEALQAHPSHSVIVLTRRSPDQVGDIGSPVVQIDYDNVESVKDVLEKHQIHTVISTVSIMGEAEGTAQVNLIRAAGKSSVTKRFAPSEWAIPYPKEYMPVMPYLKFKFDAIDELKKTGLEYTLFSNGIFMDMFGVPHVKTYVHPGVFFIDMANKAAAIPGSGDNRMDFTSTFDIAKFVVASLDLPKWPERSIIIGDKLTWNDFVKLAEEARGSKFSVTYDDAEKLEKFQVTELPGQVPMYPYFPKEALQHMCAVFGQWYVKGLFDMPYEQSLNVRFPEIKTQTVKELLDLAWKGR